MRPAQNLKPATYRCPLCGKHLPALSEHVLIWPEGDKSRRRHAHTECVMAARKAIYEKLTKTILEDLPKIYLYHRRILIAHSAKLNGYKQMPDGLVRVVGLSLK